MASRQATAKGHNEERVLEAMRRAEVDITDIESDDRYLTVFAPPAEFFKAKTALLEAHPEIELEGACQSGQQTTPLVRPPDRTNAARLGR